MAWFEGKSIMEYSGRSFEDVERYMLRDFVRQSKARWPKLGRGVARLVKHFHSESANQWELLADFTPRQLSGLNELLQELSLECVGF